MFKRWCLVLMLCPGLFAAAPKLEDKLAAYRAELDAFRAEYGGAHELPNVRFFLFGMGLRPKFLYRDGKLIDIKSGKTVREWNVESDVILPPEYRVVITREDGKKLQISEDEKGIWIAENGEKNFIEGSNVPIKLPTFEKHKYSRVLRVLHQELLFNCTAAGPVPNLFVYTKPWYRDGAMMAMALRQTGNLRSISPWMKGLSDPFDHNNAGESEPDNLGQALYLISLVSDRKHPLVDEVLLATKRFEQETYRGKFIQGRSDFTEHPVYQTKWLKFGLHALSLPDPYIIPEKADSYSALFWMDYRDQYVVAKDADDRGPYPYLGWACDHFHGTKKSPIGNRDYPLTWEQRASQANYDGMAIVDPIYVQQKLSAPHTWHAAEAFLYVSQEAGTLSPGERAGVRGSPK